MAVSATVAMPLPSNWSASTSSSWMAATKPWLVSHVPSRSPTADSDGVDGYCEPLHSGITVFALVTVVDSVDVSRSIRVWEPVAKAARSLTLALVTDMAQ